MVDADEGALIEPRAAPLIAGGRGAPLQLHSLIAGTPSESTREYDEKNGERRLTFLKKSVKSAHAISPDESIRLRFFDRRRADTCM